MAVSDRNKALEAALAQIEKAHGKGSVMKLGEDSRLPIDIKIGRASCRERV